jgi:phage terminase small subunit
MALSLKMRTFAMAFVGEANGNGTEAARIAGYKGNDGTLRAIASENLTKPNIQAFIAELRKNAEKRLDRKIMSASEVLAELSEIALASWKDFVEVKYGDEGQVVLANLRLTDKIKACELLGKHHGLFPTKIEITDKDADRLIDGAAKTHGLPLPETFGGEPLKDKEM